MSSCSRFFAYDQAVPDGQYRRTPTGWVSLHDPQQEQRGEVVVDDEPAWAALPWSRSQACWSTQPPEHVQVDFGSRGSHECQSYKTAGEILQLLCLHASVRHRPRFLYIVDLLVALFPRMLTPRGMAISGSTQKALFAVLSSACDIGPQLSGACRQRLHQLLQVAEQCAAQCHDGSVKYRTEQLSRCRAKLYLEADKADLNRVSLMHLPEDIVKRILSFVQDPEDFVELSFTCRLNT